MKNEISTHPIAHCFCKVNAIVPLSFNTYQIDLLAPENTDLNYHAGQYLQLELELDDNKKAQVLSYSIANNFNPEQPRLLQLFIHNGSDFTNKILAYLNALAQRNTSVKVTLPMGRAFLQSSLDAPHLLVAAGSGISKIKCITEEIVKRCPDAEVNIYWSNKNIDDFYLLDDFYDWGNTCKNLTFTPILESPVTGWPGRSGYIYQVIEENLDSRERISSHEQIDSLERASRLGNTSSYLCGSPQMVYGTIDKLKARGLKEENCYSDVFEYAPRGQQKAV